MLRVMQVNPSLSGYTSCFFICFRCMIMNNHDGLWSWQWYHPLENIPDRVNFGMLGDTRQNRDTQDWGTHMAIHPYPAMKLIFYEWAMCDATPFQRSWALTMATYTQSHPRQWSFWHCQRRKSWWGFPVLRVVQCKSLLSRNEEYSVWVPDGWHSSITVGLGNGNDTTHPKPTVTSPRFA